MMTTAMRMGKTSPTRRHPLLLLAACATLATLSPFPVAAVASPGGATTTPTTVTTLCDAATAHRERHTQNQPSAQEIVAELGLEPNVEGGYYTETFRDSTVLLPPTDRAVSTAIYYLLEGPDAPSVWHRVDAAEVWHWYAGAPMVLQLSSDNGTATRTHLLGPDVLVAGQRPQLVIPAHDWQRAISCGDWTLVGTTVAPAFVPEGYELAPAGWEPNDGT